MKRAIRSQRELRRRLRLPPEPDADSAERFPTFVPLELLSRIQPGNIDDPILKQVLATSAESIDHPGFKADPVGDLHANAGGGLLRKYHGRALLIAHGACAIHCRYCFRREFPYLTTGSRAEGWEPAVELVRKDDSIEEVLLSGGDPLTLTDEVLSNLISQFDAIPHVRRLRIHTRLPIAIPDRVTGSLLQRLRETRLAVWMVVHSNHPQEIDASVALSLRRFVEAGIPVLNQSVLLAGVNDNANVLIDLSRLLVDLNVQPYYLHQLDRVSGAAHFWVPVERGLEIMEEMRRRLPGYAVPRYVIEKKGESSKTLLA